MFSGGTLTYTLTMIHFFVYMSQIPRLYIYINHMTYSIVCNIKLTGEIFLDKESILKLESFEINFYHGKN